MYRSNSRSRSSRSGKLAPPAKCRGTGMSRCHAATMSKRTARSDRNEPSRRDSRLGGPHSHVAGISQKCIRLSRVSQFDGNHRHPRRLTLLVSSRTRVYLRRIVEEPVPPKASNAAGMWSKSMAIWCVRMYAASHSLHLAHPALAMVDLAGHRTTVDRRPLPAVRRDDVVGNDDRERAFCRTCGRPTQDVQSAPSSLSE